MLDFRISSINSALRKVLIRLHYPIEVMLTCVRWYVDLRVLETRAQGRGFVTQPDAVRALAQDCQSGQGVIPDNRVCSFGRYHGAAIRQGQLTGARVDECNELLVPIIDRIDAETTQDEGCRSADERHGQGESNRSAEDAGSLAGSRLARFFEGCEVVQP